MRYASFRIKNFKGIQDTTISFETIAGANVFPFVGLNESGKTTVLEAIHSFAPDEATSELLGGEEGLGVPFRERVPRHLLSGFTGDVSVFVKLTVSLEDKEAISKALLSSHGIAIEIESFPDVIEMERIQKFKNGDFVRNFFYLLSDVKIKKKSQRKWRDASSSDDKNKIRDTIYKFVPRIAYFPTFVFDFPTAIYLTDRGGTVDKFYRRAFQDILDFDARGQTVERDIIRRVRREDRQVPWVSFLSTWGQSDDGDKIQHVMDRASAAVTNLVFGRWNKIFGEETKGKEVLISYNIVQGEVEDARGTKSSSNMHDIQVKFQIKDGTRRYDVNDRSLGFRWFFSFMLFTQFRVARSERDAPPLLFLFDEPAANLHAAAQQKLVDSFPEIARDGHILAYSTHSHYMIEPKWLEQTFIVTNRADSPNNSLLDEISLEDESLDVRVNTYRSFVDSHPSQTSYFQPILDRLEVVPSKFDLREDSIVVEGKSDYYILRYAEKLLGISDLPLIPGLGAGTFGALAALHVGWNLNFIFLLDADGEGEKALKRYHEEFGIPMDRMCTLRDLIDNSVVIEDILDEESANIIQAELSLKAKPSKSQIRRYFQERLAGDNIQSLSDDFSSRTEVLLKKLRLKLNSEE